MSSDREQIKLRFPLRLPPIVHKRGWDSNFWSYTKKSDINKCFHKKQLTPLLSRGHTTFHERRMSSGHMHEHLPPLQMDGSEKMNSHLSAYVVVYGPVGCRSDHSSEYNDPKGGKISGACHYYFFLPSNVFTHCAFVCSHPASPHPHSSKTGTLKSFMLRVA